MPIRTIATDMLGIEHPIICGGMTATGSAELAAAASNAGGLGMLTALHAQTPLAWGCSDMVSLMGFDSGGLPGEADTGIFINMALAQKQLTISFIASGGIATGRQLLAALASVSSMPAKYFLHRVCALGCRWCATRHSIQRHQGVQHFPRLVQAAHDRGRPKGHCYCDEARSCIE